MLLAAAATLLPNCGYVEPWREKKKRIKEACRKLYFVAGNYKIIFYSNPPRFTQPIRPAIHDIFITKGSYAFYERQVVPLPDEVKAVFAKNKNQENWRLYEEAKELSANIKLNHGYHMIYQNKISKIFLGDIQVGYGTAIVAKNIGRLIKPNFGKSCELRKEYRDLIADEDFWYPNDTDRDNPFDINL